MDKTLYKISLVETPRKTGYADDELELVKFAIDTFGKGGSIGLWVNVYGKNNFGEEALYKEINYDYPESAYMEAAYADFAKNLLNSSVRVPKIMLVEDEKYEGTGVLSFRVLDINKEDLFHMSEYTAKKYNKKIMTFGLMDLLEGVGDTVDNKENYKILERDIVQTALADTMGNIADRHMTNWGLVRGKLSNKYQLAIFDNAGAFSNINNSAIGCGNDIWTDCYIGVETTNNIVSGDKIAKFIKRRFPEYAEEVIEKWERSRKAFIKGIEDVEEIKAFMINSIVGGKFNLLKRNMEEDYERW